MDSTGNRIYDGIEFTSTQSKTGRISCFLNQIRNLINVNVI